MHLYEFLLYWITFGFLSTILIIVRDAIENKVDYNIHSQSKLVALGFCVLLGPITLLLFVVVVLMNLFTKNKNGTDT